MQMKHKSLLLIALLSLLLVLPLLVNGASAQTPSNYYVTVKPELLGNALQYTNVGRNVTLSFVAQWSYGSNNGVLIQNATAIINVTNVKGQVVDMLSENTTTGVFSFNYSSSNPDILNFIPSKLTTQDGKEWIDANLINPGENAYEFTSNYAQVYWDTFHVSAVNFETSTLGKVTTTVNVTYQMLPQDGLQVGTVHLSKIGQHLGVSINGVSAQETTPGNYNAVSNSWLSTAYVKIKVSGYNWTTTETAFGVTQSANQPLWTYGIVFSSIAAVAAFFIRFIASKRANNNVGKHPNFPFFGGVTLAAVSVISLYWGIVGLEGSVHTFNWIGLAAFGVFAFVVGVIGSLSLTRRKYLPFTITAAIVPMIANIVVIKGSLDMYQLANPWILLAGALLLSMLNGFFICNIDSTPQKQATEPQAPSL
jgi:hypothetical protein